MATKQSTLQILISVVAIGLFLTGCSSSSVRAKKEQREKAVQTSHLYCEFVNGENNPTDVDVALNLAMAQKCDYEKPFSVSAYKTPSEVQGLVYCCGIVDKNKKEEKAMAKAEPSSDPAKSKIDKKENLPDLKPGQKTDLRSDFDTPKLPSSSPSSPSAPSTPSTPKPPADNSPYPKIPELDP